VNWLVYSLLLSLNPVFKGVMSVLGFNGSDKAAGLSEGFALDKGDGDGKMARFLAFAAVSAGLSGAKLSRRKFQLQWLFRFVGSDDKSVGKKLGKLILMFYFCGCNPGRDLLFFRLLSRRHTD
jgi:hypothetical protein